MITLMKNTVNLHFSKNRQIETRLSVRLYG